MIALIGCSGSKGFLLHESKRCRFWGTLLIIRKPKPNKNHTYPSKEAEAKVDKAGRRKCGKGKVSSVQGRSK